ncbi:MAG: hypothetical protein QM743_08695 [Chitinophagaceae bacterium]
MANEKLSVFTTAPDIVDVDFFIGVRKTGQQDQQGNDIYVNRKYTPEALIAYLKLKMRKRITVVADNIGGGGSTLTDPFFSDTIEEIATLTQNFIRGENFTQSGTTITIKDSSFYDGQILIAKK